MDSIVKAKSYQKLGFQKLEAAEVVKHLNITLCTYQVFFHKLQNFHWNVIGNDFMDIHMITEELYRQSLENIDEIAERIRVFGETPKYTMKAYAQDSIIEETTHDKSADFMVLEILEDIEALSETMLDIHEYAAKNGDIGSTHMVEKMIKNLETYHWKLSAWRNSKFGL